ncbi:MMPL family transporter [Embleya sp. NBC_00896]|uniref:MMPL family transporter n=1 Tax=Embleya sp. NBC_00896 TaxID=2975961 RepID=UPI003868595E|nr:MMPL family transporter [Embleya sp. NBC_00896]
MFGRLGRLVVHNPWKVIAGWVVAAVALVLFAPSLSDLTNQDQASFLPSKYESVQADKLAEKAFPQSTEQTALLVFKRGDGNDLTEADKTKVKQIAADLGGAGVEHVSKVEAGPAEGKIALATSYIKGEEQDKFVNEALKDLRDKAKPMVEGTDLKLGFTGGVAINVDNEEAFKKAEAIVGIVTIVLIIVLLLAIYRSPIAALLPVLMVFLVSMVASPVIAIVGKATGLQVDQSLNTILIVVLFGIGTDYILFLLFRYRERLRAGDDKKQAMIVSVERVGEAIASAAGAVVIAFGAMLLATFGSFKSMGPGLAIAVIVMAIAALTLVPAVVSLIGPKVFWPSKTWQKTPKGTAFNKIGGLVGRKPAAVAIVSGVIMVAFAAGALNFKADYDQLSQLPSDTESAKAMKDMQLSFPAGTLNPTKVYVQSKAGAKLDRAAVERFATSLTDTKGVDEVSAVGDVEPKPHAKYSDDGTSAEIGIILKDSPFANSALDTIKPLRAEVHEKAPEGTKVMVGGSTASFTDIRSATNRDLSVIFPVAGLLIALVLGLLLRSVVAPWYLMLAVVLGFISTIGATVLVFQTLMGNSGVMFMLPVMIYMFVVAIGTDYNILMVARLREEAKEGHEPRKAAALAVEHAGPSIAAAGVILAGTFASLMMAGIDMMTQMGFAVSIGICISAFVMSMFLVPSVTALIGHKAWWPGHGDRARPETGRGYEDREPVLAGDR